MGAGGGGCLDHPRKPWAPLNPGEGVPSRGAQNCLQHSSRARRRGSSVGLDHSAVKGLRVRVIKDLNCHVGSKPGSRPRRGLNKSALDSWPDLIQQKIISAEY